MRNQGRNDFVDTEVQRLEQIAAVVETQIPAKNLRDFFTKKGRPVIYGAFVASVYGERIQGGGPVTKPMHITSTIVQEMLDENGELRPVQGQYAIGDAYNCIKTVYNMCTNPGGLQVANYILLLTKAIFIAQHFAEDKRFPKTLDKLIKSLTKGEHDSFRYFLEDLQNPMDSSAAMQVVVSQVVKQSGPIQTWRTSQQMISLVQRTTQECVKYCTATCKRQKLNPRDIEKLFEKFPRSDQGINQLYANCSNEGVSALWLFYPKQDRVVKLVDIRSLRTLEVFNDLSKLTQTANKRDKDKMLNYVWMRKSWDAMSTLLVIADPFLEDHRDYIKLQADKFWKDSLSRKDFNKKTQVLEYFVAQVKGGKHNVEDWLGRVFIKFLGDITKAVKPIPGLEMAPTSDDEDKYHKEMLHLQIQEDSAPIAVQLEERRLQMEKFGQSGKKDKDDSGMIIPILILGIAIFMFSK